MKRNMRAWVEDLLKEPTKKAMPILSFPGTQLIGAKVEELVKDGHLQALCMASIAKRYPMGMAVSLMDLSVEAEAFGSSIRFEENEVPTVTAALIHNEKEAKELQIPKVGNGRTGECIRCIEEACELITDRPIFAGIIGPFSLAGRLLDMTEIMFLCYDEPEMVEIILNKATEFLVSYAEALKAVGANGLIMAEPAAGLLSPSFMNEFSTPYVNKIREAVEDENFLVIYHNCGSVEPLMKQLEGVKVQAYSFGNAIDIEVALKELPENRLILGNLDPSGILREGTPETVRKETKNLLEQCAKYSNYVISSGCDIPPATPIENLDAFFEAIEDFYKG